MFLPDSFKKYWICLFRTSFKCCEVVKSAETLQNYTTLTQQQVFKLHLVPPAGLLVAQSSSNGMLLSCLRSSVVRGHLVEVRDAHPINVGGLTRCAFWPRSSHLARWKTRLHFQVLRCGSWSHFEVIFFFPQPAQHTTIQGAEFLSNVSVVFKNFFWKNISS